MEFPGAWNLLTASLAVCELNAADDAWAFITTLQLVDGSPEAKAQFLDIAQAEIAQGPITGGTLAFRVSEGLRAAGLVRPRADEPDGWAKTAGQLKLRFDKGERLLM